MEETTDFRIESEKLYTNSTIPIECTHVQDSRIPMMNKDMRYEIKTTPSEIGMSKVEASSFSDSGVNFQFQTRSDNSLVDRRIYLQMEFNITARGNIPIGERIFSKATSAPRAFPISSITDTLKLTLNGVDTSINAYNDMVKALCRSNKSYDNTVYDLSGTPTYLDTYLDYASAFDSMRNPLAGYDTVGEYGKIPRGAFELKRLSNPVSTGIGGITTATLSLNVYEPLFISPLFVESKDGIDSSIANLRNIAVSLNFQAGKMNRIFSMAVNTSHTITEFTATVNSAFKPTLYVQYITPPITKEIPPILAYNYHRIQVHRNLGQEVPANSDLTLLNNTISMAFIPKALYIWVQKQRSTLDRHDADVFFSINSCNISYMNRSGQLSDFTSKDLFNLSVRNGLDCSWNEWQGRMQNYNGGSNDSPATRGEQVKTTGSLLIINYSDLSLTDNLTSGVGVNGQLEISLNVTNNYDINLVPEIMVMEVTQGIACIGNGTMTLETSVLTQEITTKMKNDSLYPPTQITGDKLNLMGGGIFDTIKSIGRKALDFGKKACDHFDNVHSIADPMLSSQGAGHKEGHLGGMLVGGKALSKQKLRKNLMS